MHKLKKIILTFAFILCVYVVLGGYIAAMFSGKLPMMKNNEPARMCAVFQDGTKFGLDSVISIDAYHEKTKQSFDYERCDYGKWQQTTAR
ncbi:hypothetical protein ZP9_00038 [Shewanella phage ZP9]|nr:hypothetical protein ZP9_00038 [Shewanella phage ZP9]